MSQIATIEPKRSLIVAMANKYDMEPTAFANTLKATCVPANTSNEEFAAFLMVAKQYNLNPITKEIYAFPKRGGGIQPIVSVDGWANLINSHPQCDGFEFFDHLDDEGKLTAITCKMYRKDRSHPSTATEYMAECRRDTDTWRQWPRRMLRHKALIQTGRYTFGFAGIADPDEAERMADGGHYAGTPGQRLVPSPPPAPKAIAKPESEAIKPASTALPGEWQQYLERQADEFHATEDAAAKNGVSEAVTDAIQAARERGELSGEEQDAISEAWNEMVGSE